MADSDAAARESAIAGARAALGLDARAPVRSWKVERLHAGGRGFVLAIFGEPERATAIAAVDPASGEVLESARLPGTQPHSLLTADQAILRAGLPTEAQAQLVWDPSPATRSRFYPLWQLQDGERRVWVDSVRGTVWKTLDAPARGGAGGA